jgi:hypothetical protein
MLGGAARLLLRCARPPRVAPLVCATAARRTCGARARFAPPRAAAMQAAGASAETAAPAVTAAASASAAAERDSATAADCDPVGAPLFSFGVLTDVQYADIPDGQSFGGTPRFYRHSLEGLRCALPGCSAQRAKVARAFVPHQPRARLAPAGRRWRTGARAT